jgi:hypothetical protein
MVQFDFGSSSTVATRRRKMIRIAMVRIAAAGRDALAAEG